MIHKTKSLLAGKKVKIKKHIKHRQYPNFGGSEILIEDWWDRVYGQSWMVSDGNPACIVYALRGMDNIIPIDDEVLYGKVGHFGSLVHISELEVDLCK